MLLAVADGMGGHAAGEVASALAIDTIRDAVTAGADLAEACLQANRRVHAMSRSDPAKRGMGTTLVILLADAATFTLANVGDSRGYLVTADGVRQLTEDHSFVAEAIRKGTPEEEARRSPWKDALTRSIGIDAEVKVDVFGPFPVARDMAVVLCSDGLYKVLGDGDVRRVFSGSTDVEDAARSLAAEAYEAGSDDNITVVVAEHGRVPRDAPAGSATAGSATLRLERPFEGPVPSPRREPVPAAEGTAANGGNATLKVIAVVLALAAAAALFLGLGR